MSCISFFQFMEIGLHGGVGKNVAPHVTQVELENAIEPAPTQSQCTEAMIVIPPYWAA